jgi:hypothetical protein
LKSIYATENFLFIRDIGEDTLEDTICSTSRSIQLAEKIKRIKLTNFNRSDNFGATTDTFRCLQDLQLESNNDKDQDFEFKMNTENDRKDHLESHMICTTNPLRRPRSTIDEAIDGIIRKHRKLYDSGPASVLELQLIPVGPDPLQDQRWGLGNSQEIDSEQENIFIQEEKNDHTGRITTSLASSLPKRYHAGDFSHSEWFLEMEYETIQENKENKDGMMDMS